MELENQPSPCIFRVSPALSRQCKDAFVPQIAFIGPYHRNANLMPGIKIDAVKRVVARCELEDAYLWDTMIENIQMKFDDKSRYYDLNSLPHGTHELHWGIAMIEDACFILEFFRCLLDEFVEDSCENLESFGSNFNPLMRSEIMKDLIKLENQIPLFVLEDVVAMEMKCDLQKAKSSLQHLLKFVFNKFYYRPFDSVDASAELSRCNHILDASYHYCLGDERLSGPQKLKKERQKEKDFWTWLENSMEECMEDLEKQPERQKVPSAVQLNRVGVKIKAINRRLDGKKLYFPPPQDILFDGQTRTLHIPPVELDSNSEIFIRNLMALEICYPYGSLRRMTAYARFMNELCQTEEGAVVMRQNGVIAGNIWQPSQIAGFFSSISQSHTVPGCDSIEVTRK